MSLHRVFVIGGMGKWFNNTYRPVLSSRSDAWQIVGVAELNFRLDSSWSGFRLGLSGHPGSDIPKFQEALSLVQPDLVIIASEPTTHFEFALASIQFGVDVICDKPPIAIKNQLSNAGKSGQKIRACYEALRKALEASRHRRHANRRCRFLLPLRRRVHRPFGTILEWIDEVCSMTSVHPTQIDISFNDGSFRLQGEYDRPGAHGYRNGLGGLTHTGYHYVDFIACCAAPLDSRSASVETVRLPSSTCCDDQGVIDQAFLRMLGARVSAGSPIGPNETDSALTTAEVDARFASTIFHEDGQQTRVYLAALHRGCTRRTIEHLPLDATHDSGRVDDVSLHLHQGPFQSIQLSMVDNAGGTDPFGYCRLSRRLHPQLARMLQAEEIAVFDSKLLIGDAAGAYANTVAGFLEEVSWPLESIIYENTPRFSLESQRLTMELYASYFD